MLGVLIGAAGAIRQYKFSDYFTTVVSLLILSTPCSCVATLLKYGALEINSATGNADLPVHRRDLGEHDRRASGRSSSTACSIWCCRPSALALGSIAGYSRYQRNAMLDVLGSDFIRTARAKGLTRRRRCSSTGCAPR